MAKNKNKKNKGSILPVLVIAIVVFLAYKANPEYWQQGRLFEDLKNRGQKKVETQDVAVIPEKKDEKPAVDPDAILPGTVKGAKKIPININKKVNKDDPTYWTLRTKFKTIYLVYPQGNTADNIMSGINDALKKNNMKEEWNFTALLYDSKNKKQRCDVTEPQAFLCKQCDRKICLINPRNSEFIVVAPTVQASIGRAKALSGKDAW